MILGNVGRKKAVDRITDDAKILKKFPLKSREFIPPDASQFKFYWDKKDWDKHGNGFWMWIFVETGKFKIYVNEMPENSGANLFFIEQPIRSVDTLISDINEIVTFLNKRFNTTFKMV